MNTNRKLAISFSVVAGVATAVACGGSGDGGGSAVFGGTGGSSASGNTGGSGASTGGGFGTGGFGTGGSGADGGLNADSACANLTVQAERLPVAMYIMLDKSGSMDQNGSQKWSDAVTGITTFVNSPKATGMKVALQYFPGGGDCDGTGYNVPDVPMAALPGNKAAIIASLNATTPNGNTPTEGALNGLRRFCKTYDAQHPGETCVGLMVTDGQPNGCDETPATLAGICTSSFKNAPSVQIFTMGMDGADFTLLDQLAAAGGTTKAFDISTGGATAFVNALLNIAGQILTCEYAMPTSDGGVVNPASIIMNYTPGTGADQPLDLVADKAACGTGTNGFYYDDPTSPTKISLCPSTCTKLQADTKGKVEILLDCTKIGNPH